MTGPGVDATKLMLQAGFDALGLLRYHDITAPASTH